MSGRERVTALLREQSRIAHQLLRELAPAATVVRRARGWHENMDDHLARIYLDGDHIVFEWHGAAEDGGYVKRARVDSALVTSEDASVLFATVRIAYPMLCHDCTARWPVEVGRCPNCHTPNEMENAYPDARGDDLRALFRLLMDRDVELAAREIKRMELVQIEDLDPGQVRVLLGHEDPQVRQRAHQALGRPRGRKGR